MALARSIFVKCGRATINGQAFCQGLARLGLPTADHPDIQARIASLTYLISGAPLRLGYDADSLGDLSLPELVDIYQNREVTEPLDRVYALLSMASDVSARDVFRPTYNITWPQLFTRLATYALGNMISVRVLSLDTLLVQSFCTVRGKIRSVEPSSKGRQFQTVVIDSFDEGDPPYRMDNDIRRSIRLTANSVKPDDLVCVLEGAQRLAIIRPHKDYFLLILLSFAPTTEKFVTPGKTYQFGPRSTVWDAVDRLGVGFRAELLWRWQAGSSVDETVDDSLGSLSPDERLYEMATALNDSGQYDKSISTIRRLQSRVEMVGRRDPLFLASQDLMSLAYKRQGNLEKARDYTAETLSERKDTLGLKHPWTLRSRAQLAMIQAERTAVDLRMRLKVYGDQEGAKRMEMLVRRVLKGLVLSEADARHLIHFGHLDLIQTVMELTSAAIPLPNQLTRHVQARGGGMADVLKLLLSSPRLDTDVFSVDAITDAVVFDPRGEDVIDIIASLRMHKSTLLPHRPDIRDLLTRSIILRVFELRRHNSETMGKLLGQWKSMGLSIKEFGRAALVNDLLEPRALEVILESCGSGLQADVELGLEFLCGSLDWLLDSFMDRAGAEVQLAPRVVEDLVRQRHKDAPGVLRVLLSHLDSDFNVSVRILEAAVDNQENSFVMLDLLASHMGEAFQVSTEVLRRIALDNERSIELMTIIWSRQGLPSPLEVTAEVVEALSKNEEHGALIFELLLDEASHVMPITENALVTCAQYGSMEMMKMLIARAGSTLRVTDDMWRAVASHRLPLQSGIPDLFIRHIAAAEGDTGIAAQAVSNMMNLARKWEDLEPAKGLVGMFEVTDTIAQGICSLTRRIKDGRSSETTDDPPQTPAVSTFIRLCIKPDQDVAFTNRTTRRLVTELDYPDLAGIFLDTLKIDEDAIEAAARNPNPRTLDMLLQRADGDGDGVGVIVTETALDNARDHPENLQRLLDRLDGSQIIPDRIVMAASRWMSIRHPRVLDRLQVSHDVCDSLLSRLVEEAAASNRKVFEFLFEYFGDRLPITSWVVESAAAAKRPTSLMDIQRYRPRALVLTDRVIGRAGTPAVLKWLLNFGGGRIQLACRLLWRLCWFGRNDRGFTMRPLLQRIVTECRLDNRTATEEILVILAQGFEDEEVRLVLDRVVGSLCITGKIVRNILRNMEDHISTWRKVQRLWLFFERIPPGVSLGEDVMVALAEDCDSDLMAHVFDYYYWDGRLVITDRVIEAATRNKHTLAMMKLLLNHAWADQSTTGTSKVVAAVAKYLSCNRRQGTVNQLLLRAGHGGLGADNANIETVVMRGLENDWASVAEILTTPTSHALQDPPRPQEEVVTKTLTFGKQRSEHPMFNGITGNLEITGAIIEAAVATKDDNYDVSRLRRLLGLMSESHGTLRVTSEALYQSARVLDAHVMSQLLEGMQDDSMPDLELILKGAAQNDRSGEQIATLLLERVIDDRITDGVMARVAEFFSVALMKRVLERVGGPDAALSSRVMDAAAGSIHGDAMLRMLCSSQRPKNSVQVTASMVEKAAGSPRAESLLRCILEAGVDNVELTTDQALRAAAGQASPVGILTTILDRWKAANLPISEAVLVAAVENPDLEGFMTLCHHYGEADLPLTELVLQAAVMAGGNREIDGEHILSLLLRIHGCQAEQGKARPVSETILHALRTADQAKCRDRVMDLEQMKPTSAVFLHATRHDSDDPRAWEYKLCLADPRDLNSWPSTAGDPVYPAWHGEVPDYVVHNALRDLPGHAALEHLYYESGQTLKITEPIMLAALQGRENGRYARPTLRFIFSRWPTEARALVTEDVMAGAARLPARRKVLEFLFHEVGREFPVTEKVLQAAAGNLDGASALKQLVELWGWWRMQPVTEPVLVAAAANPQGKGVLLFFIWRCGKENITITKAVVEAARANPKRRDLLGFIAERWGEDVLSQH